MSAIDQQLSEEHGLPTDVIRALRDTLPDACKKKKGRGTGLTDEGMERLLEAIQTEKKEGVAPAQALPALGEEQLALVHDLCPNPTFVRIVKPGPIRELTPVRVKATHGLQPGHRIRVAVDSEGKWHCTEPRLAVRRA